MTLTIEDLRVISGWAADCAEPALPLFENAVRDDTRPRAAIEGAREFARGGRRIARLRVLALNALSAARETPRSAAGAAARAACEAAASSYTHPLPSASQARHILGAAVYAALAREAANGPDAGLAALAQARQLASPTLREILGRFSAQPPGASRRATLFHELDAALRTAAPQPR